jgi:hypothetical protein
LKKEASKLKKTNQVIFSESLEKGWSLTLADASQLHFNILQTPSPNSDMKSMDMEVDQEPDRTHSPALQSEFLTLLAKILLRRRQDENKKEKEKSWEVPGTFTQER